MIAQLLFEDGIMHLGAFELAVLNNKCNYMMICVKKIYIYRYI